MENKELWKQEYSESDIKISAINVDSSGVDGLLVVGLGKNHTIRMSSHHDQDCCESVYADFDPMKAHASRLIDKTLRSLTVKGVSGMGFLLVFETGYEEFEKVFIPCYNSQNGYYSSSLHLDIQVDAGHVERVDISEFVEDLIN